MGNLKYNDPNYQKQYAIDNREKKLAYQRARSNSYNLLAGAKRRSKVNNYDFDLEVSDIIVPTHCPVLGIELVIARGNKGPLPNSPTLDRVDVRFGYVKGNVQVISWRANTLKKDASIAEVEAILNYMKTHNKSNTKV